VPRELSLTRAIRSGIASDRHHNAVTPPIHLSSTFAFEGFGRAGQYDYTRSGNPTRDLLAEALAELEGGSRAIVTCTGMSAVGLVLNLLRPGDLILAPHDCYGGTHRLLTHLARRGLFDVEFVDFTEWQCGHPELSDSEGRATAPGHPERSDPAGRAVEGSAFTDTENSRSLHSRLRRSVGMTGSDRAPSLEGSASPHTTNSGSLHSRLRRSVGMTGDDRAPSLVWIETPSNPLLRITDIRAVADAAYAVGALVVVDNTFLSPLWQQPFEHGADIVVHSTTKYLNGHSDVVGGAVIARDADLGEELAWWANATGVTGAPFDSWLTLRGIRTLQARGRIHDENTDELVRLLDGHPAVARVHYPGLRGHSGHDIATRQQLGFGAMASFELRGGEDAVRAFLAGLEFFTLAESLGGTESLVAHPATMTHASMDQEARRVAGISDTLLRLSVGIEELAALSADLEHALERASRAAEVA
jgi:cystathionine beta-lyase/cystathionine gamma-synthase